MLFLNALADTVVKTHPALHQHLTGPLARKAARAQAAIQPLATANRAGRLKVARYLAALDRAATAAEKPPKAVKVPVSLGKVWTLETARVAFQELAASGLSQTAFAKLHGFSASRFSRWAKRVNPAE